MMRKVAVSIGPWRCGRVRNLRNLWLGVTISRNQRFLQYGMPSIVGGKRRRGGQTGSHHSRGRQTKHLIFGGFRYGWNYASVIANDQSCGSVRQGMALTWVVRKLVERKVLCGRVTFDLLALPRLIPLRRFRTIPTVQLLVFEHIDIAEHAGVSKVKFDDIIAVVKWCAWV